MFGVLQNVLLWNRMDLASFLYGSVCLQTNPYWYAIRSCQGVKGAPEEFGVGTDITTKGHSCRGVFSQCLSMFILLKATKSFSALLQEASLVHDLRCVISDSFSVK